MYRGGLSYMRHSISDTAEYGDYVSGPRIVTDQTRAAMKQILAEIQSGKFAKDWIAENETGRIDFDKTRLHERELVIERVGADLRKMMPFVDPIVARPGERG